MTASEGSITVLVDRDSVAMGDDVDSHDVTWTLPGDATVRDLVRRITRYLPSVSGAQVAWLLHAGAGSARPIVALFMQGSSTQFVSELDWGALDRPIVDVRQARSGDDWSFRCSYHTAGRLQTWAEVSGG